MAQLQLINVNKIYPNGFHAVYDFNLEIRDSEFIVLVGPSGCGKSTTLRMIAGLEDISDGEFYINGNLMNDKSPKARGVTMVFQSYALYPHLSVYDNMAFGLNMQGLDADVIEKRVVRTAHMLGLDDYLDRKPRALSGGQRQRVAVGRAIIRRVDVFLMDEPLSNLDAKQRVTMRSELIQVHRRVGATTIYVTHDQTEAMTMADRIVVMKDGYVQQVGTPFELYFKPTNEFVAGFIGEPPMNLLTAMIKNKTGYIGNSKASLNLAVAYPKMVEAYEGKRFTFGFRPEGAVICSADEKVTDGVKIEAMVELTELLGDNANVYANVGDNKVIIKVSPYAVPAVDTKVYFKIPYSSIYMFDKTTEKIITLDN